MTSYTRLGSIFIFYILFGTHILSADAAEREKDIIDMEFCGSECCYKVDVVFSLLEK